MIEIRESQWGWTAYHPKGFAIAHSHKRTLLEEYVADSVPADDE